MVPGDLPCRAVHTHLHATIPTYQESVIATGFRFWNDHIYFYATPFHYFNASIIWYKLFSRVTGDRSADQS